MAQASVRDKISVREWCHTHNTENLCNKQEACRMMTHVTPGHCNYFPSRKLNSHTRGFTCLEFVCSSKQPVAFWFLPEYSGLFLRLHLLPLLDAVPHFWGRYPQPPSPPPTLNCLRYVHRHLSNILSPPALFSAESVLTDSHDPRALQIQLLKTETPSIHDEMCVRARMRV